MIIVEERLQELFATLPTITVAGKAHQPLYDFGSHKDLLRYMNSERKEKGAVQYPLVWFETPVTTPEVRNGNLEGVGISLILATLTKSQFSNRARLDITIKPTLEPLRDDVINALNKSGFTTIVNDKQIDRTIYYNYGVDEEQTQTTDIWDAIKLDLQINMTSNCLRNINY